MKRKWIPPFLMLFAGAVSSIIMFLLHYETQNMLAILLGVLIVFYIIGSLFKWMLDVFDKQNYVEETEDEEGMVEEITSEMDADEGQVKVEG